MTTLKKKTNNKTKMLLYIYWFATGYWAPAVFLLHLIPESKIKTCYWAICTVFVFLIMYIRWHLFVTKNLFCPYNEKNKRLRWLDKITLLAFYFHIYQTYANCVEQAFLVLTTSFNWQKIIQNWDLTRINSLMTDAMVVYLISGLTVFWIILKNTSQQQTWNFETNTRYACIKNQIKTFQWSFFLYVTVTCISYISFVFWVVFVVTNEGLTVFSIASGLSLMYFNWNSCRNLIIKNDEIKLCSNLKSSLHSQIKFFTDNILVQTYYVFLWVFSEMVPIICEIVTYLF